MSNKKHLKRYNMRLKIRYGIEQPVKTAFTEDVSMTGLFISGHDVVKIGKILVIEIFLSDGVKITLKGCVMWAKELPNAIIGQGKKAGMGVKIVEFHFDGEKVWKDFIARSDDFSKAGDCSAMASQDSCSLGICLQVKQ
jgi:hypothetical protein